MIFYSCFLSISIHALRKEGDPDRSCIRSVDLQFLSTPSVRRATTENGDGTSEVVFLSTPSARRATVLKWSCRETKIISIHALREEGDSTATPV